MFEAQVTQKQKESCQTWTTTMQRVPDIMLQSTMAATPVVLGFQWKGNFLYLKTPTFNLKLFYLANATKL